MKTQFEVFFPEDFSIYARVQWANARGYSVYGIGTRYTPAILTVPGFWMMKGK